MWKYGWCWKGVSLCHYHMSNTWLWPTHDMITIAPTPRQNLFICNNPATRRSQNQNVADVQLPPMTTCILKIDSKWTIPFIFQIILHVCRVHNVKQGLTLCVMTSQGLMPAMNADLSCLKLKYSKWHHQNFPGRWLRRPAFIAGIKSCDVIMHKVFCSLLNKHCVFQWYTVYCIQYIVIALMLGCMLPNGCCDTK